MTLAASLHRPHVDAVQLPDNPVLYLVIAVLAGISFAAAQYATVRRLASLALWLGLIGVLTIVFVEQGRFHPTIALMLDKIALDPQRVVGTEVRVPLGVDGHFWVRADLGDGIGRRMLVDTGATITALSPATANAVGAAVARGPVPVIMQTANGAALATPATLDRLRVGGIEARDLAVVVTPGLGSTDVIGMNFLTRLKSWRVENHTLILVPEPTS